MLYEFAIEPAVVYTLERLQRCVGEFGVQHGRLIVKFPKMWAKLVEAVLASSNDIQTARVVLCLEQLKRAMVSGRGTFDEEAGWLASAAREHERQPFRAVIVEQKPAAKSGFLLFSELDHSEPLWKVDHSKCFARTPEEIAVNIGPLVRISREIILVDPYFRPSLTKYQKTLRALAYSAERQRGGLPMTRFEIHTTLDRPYETLDSGEFLKSFEEKLPDLVPAGRPLSVVLWEEKDGRRLHNRYVLTERGGILVGTGLDPHGSGEDDLCLLSDDHNQTLLRRYDLKGSTFKLNTTRKIVGTGPKP
jgi:hypothetical protein